MHFEYGEEEIAHLKERDSRLSKVIDFVGTIREPINEDIFSALVYHILGQQISAHVQDIIYERVESGIGEITPENILEFGRENLRAQGMSYRKADTILSIAEKVISKEIDLSLLEEMSDDDVIRYLSQLKGIGTWTAEMILMFSLKRPNVFTFLDIALKRGLKMIYGEERIDRKRFEEFRERFSPYCSVASLYIWAIGEKKVDGVDEFIKTLEEPE